MQLFVCFACGINTNFYCLLIIGFWQSFLFQKAKVVSVSNFFENVWLKILSSTSHFLPVFPLNLNHFRFCSILREDLGPPFFAEKMFKLKSSVAITFWAAPWNSVLSSEQHPVSLELTDYTFISQEQGPGIIYL